MTTTSSLPGRGSGDDIESFDPGTSFGARMHRDLTARGFEVWFDRMAMPSRGLTFHQEIQDAVAARERLVLVVGPKAAVADYVRQEWHCTLQADKAVTAILRQGDYPLVPDELKLIALGVRGLDAALELLGGALLWSPAPKKVAPRRFQSSVKPEHSQSQGEPQRIGSALVNERLYRHTSRSKQPRATHFVAGAFNSRTVTPIEYRH